MTDGRPLPFLPARGAAGLVCAIAYLALASLLRAAPTTDAATAQPGPADWPQYRGPAANGVSPETGFDKDWRDGEPAVVWKVPLGSGFSGLSIAGGRIYTLFGKDGKEYLGAFAAKDGATLWRLTIGPERGDQFGDGPRATPVIESGTVYAVGAFGVMVAADAATGAKRWRVDLREAVGARVPTWGVAAQPTVVGNLVIHNAGGRDHAVVALDRTDGSLMWKAGDDIPGYSQPLVAKIAGREQAVIFSGSQVLSVDPRNGDVLWNEPWKTSYDVNAATPILVPPNRVFISSGYDTGAAMLEVTSADGKLAVRRLWSSIGMKNQFSSSIFFDGFIYGFDDKILKCLDASTGGERWAARGFGHGSLLWADGHLVILGDRGTLAIAQATPDAYRERSRAQPLEGKHWTVPTLHGGRLFIRNENHLACLDVSG